MAYDLLGKRFGHLLVVEKAVNTNHGERHWLCECDCGGTHISTSYNLLHGKSTQCRECSLKQIKVSNTKHGTEPILLWRVYQNMKTRCTNPKYKLYHRYGGRGISVCEEWMDSFVSFRDWALQNGYREGLTLDRIDNDGNYCPQNCKWSTVTEQANNRHTNRYVCVNGEKMTLAAASRKYGIPYSALQARLNSGWDAESATTIPVRKAGVHRWS